MRWPPQSAQHLGRAIRTPISPPSEQHPPLPRASPPAPPYTPCHPQVSSAATLQRSTRVAPDLPETPAWSCTRPQVLHPLVPVTIPRKPTTAPPRLASRPALLDTAQRPL